MRKKILLLDASFKWLYYDIHLIKSSFSKNTTKEGGKTKIKKVRFSFILQSMLLGNSELQLGVPLCRLFFFRAFLHSFLVACRTHIKQLSESTEVKFYWLAVLSGGSVVLKHANTQLHFHQWEVLFRNGFEESFCHTENWRTWNQSRPLVVKISLHWWLLHFISKFQLAHWASLRYKKLFKYNI